MRRIIETAALAALILGAPTIAPGAEEIGSVAAVNRDLEGTPPGAATRALLLGDRVISNERLVSSPVGSGQMLFLDQTSLTVSPNSEIILDKYVYDPETETGEIGVTVARGVMRLIGGRITKTNDAVIGTPTATIGIRGGIALITVGADGTTRAMHVAGEHTRIEAGDQVLNLTRPNAFAAIGPGGAPEYLGVASEAEIAALYNQMQGGGGGSDAPIEEAEGDAASVSALNSERPGIVFAAPISTAGERPVTDNSIEVEQLTVAASPDVTEIADRDELIDGGSPPVNPFAGFVGGALLADNQPFVDDDGVLIANPASQNFLFADEALTATSFEQGSFIVNLEDGGRIVLPEPASSGFFSVGFAETSSPVGQLSGTGFADLDSGLYAYYVRTRGAKTGIVFGAEPGPGQLRGLNQSNPKFRVTTFRILPDLNISAPGTAAPFLPQGLGGLFDNGRQTSLFLISRPNQPLFGPGGGAASDRGNRWLLPAFRLQGAGDAQSFYMSVGASPVVNNGSDAPELVTYSRGAFRVGGDGAASRIQPFVGTLAIGDGGGEKSVFGRSNDYLVLGNSNAHALDDEPDDENVASFFQNILGGGERAYGNTHLAQRAGAQFLAPGGRIGFGATPADFATETGLSGANQFAANETRFLSFGYSSGAAVLRDRASVEKLLFRTAANSSTSAAAQFSLTKPSGAVVVDMDEALNSSKISGARLTFGGARSGVIDKDRFGMREHPDPAQLQSVLLDTGASGNAISTSFGDLSGKPATSFGETAWRGALVSHGLADARSIYPASTPLKPKYLTWGWWTGQFRFADDDPMEFGGARLQFSLGAWVAGDRTDTLPTAGAATFKGPVTVNNMAANGADFVDGGRFRMTFDFAQRAGQAGFQDVLNLPDFIVPVNDSTGRQGLNDYGGALNFAPGGDATGVRVDGSFFDGPQKNDARATAGSLRIQNESGSITATGTYWGER